MSSVITREEISDWVWVYESKSGQLDIDDIHIIARQLAYELEGEEWDYDLDDDSTMLLIFRGQ
jgi:hypothetical protein